jgi:hypothetical protein
MIIKRWSRPPGALGSTPARSSPVTVRTNHVDRLGKISLRRAGRMHHLGVGAAHAGSAVTILIDADTVTVIHQDTGEVLSEHTIDPDRSYWRNQQKRPGRWPGRNQ